MDPVNVVTADIPVETQQLDFLSMLNVTMDRAAQLKESKKLEREKLEAELMQHDDYAVAAESLKENQEAKKSARKRAMADPICTEIQESIKNLGQQIKEENQSTNVAALQYKEKSGTNSFMRNGHEIFIVQVAKFVQKRKKRSSFPS